MIDLKDYIPFEHGQCIINKNFIVRIEYFISEEIKPSIKIVMTDKTLIFNFQTNQEAKDFITYIKSDI